MFDLLDIQGEWFCVTEDLAASRTLVTPKAVNVSHPQTQTSDRFLERNGIVVLGIAYEYIGNNVGFDLFSDDDTFVTGTTTSIKRWATRAPAVANSLVSFSTPSGFCMPLAPSNNISTPTNGASLRLALSGSPVGWVSVWGVHGSIATKFPRGSFTGSPISF